MQMPKSSSFIVAIPVLLLETRQLQKVPFVQTVISAAAYLPTPCLSPAPSPSHTHLCAVTLPSAACSSMPKLHLRLEQLGTRAAHPGHHRLGDLAWVDTAAQQVNTQQTAAVSTPLSRWVRCSRRRVVQGVCIMTPRSVQQCNQDCNNLLWDEPSGLDITARPCISSCVRSPQLIPWACESNCSGRC